MSETDLTQNSALILVVDGLRPQYLSCHGNTWVDTPNVNRLVAESQTFENAIADSYELTACLKSLFTGTSANYPEPANQWRSACESFRQHDIECVLITDDSEFASGHDLASDFDQVVLVQWPSPGTDLAESIEQTHLAACFSQVMDALPRLASPFLCIVYLSSLVKIWDAPYHSRMRFVEEGDPPPPELIDPVHATVGTSDVDPDYLLGLSRAYAAQVELLDECFGVLLDDIHDNGMRDQMLIVLTSTRGFPLGEHDVIGFDSPLVFSEIAHVPLIIHVPQSELASARRQVLVQPSQLLPTVMTWFGVNVGDELAIRRESLWPILDNEQSVAGNFVYMIDGPMRAIWTDAWFLTEYETEIQLFVKPDDRWEVNRVEDRCENVVKQLREVLDHCAARIDAGERCETIPLADELK